MVLAQPYLVVLDLAGVFVFALSGALAAVRARLDVFGVVVVGTATALGGGILRDVLLGRTPPASLRDWRYLVVAAVASLLTFAFHRQVGQLRRWMLGLDALGLGLFAVTGTSLALATPGLPWATVPLIGVLTAVGGGVLRDVLLREIPVVLRREIYAVAALAGAVVVLLGHRVLGERADLVVALVALLLTSGIRLAALARRWNAPTARGLDG